MLSQLLVDVTMLFLQMLEVKFISLLLFPLGWWAKVCYGVAF